MDLYELTMAQVYFKEKKDTVATFDLFIRSDKRPFYVVAGITEFLGYLEQLRFTPADIQYLQSLNLFEQSYLDYLAGFSFSGEVYAVKDGTVVFAQEPIVSVTAPLIQAQIIESAIINIINLHTTLLTKAVRVVQAAGGRKVFDFSLRRAQGVSAALVAAKCAYLAGADGTSNVMAGSWYGIDVVGTMAHSYIMTFSSEIESFLKFSRSFPKQSIFLVDTYDTRKGIAAAIEVGKRLKKEGSTLKGIRLDSGDLGKDARYAREMLDTEGLIDTFIIASGDLDEYKIRKLVAQKVPIDAFGVGTNMGVSADAPFTDMIYKLAELTSCDQRQVPTMKLSKGKMTLPGKKQIFRKIDAQGYIAGDYIGLRNERIVRTKSLLSLVFQGKAVQQAPESLLTIRQRIKESVQQLPASFRNAPGKSTVAPAVKITAALEHVREKTRDHLQKESGEIVFMDVDTQYDFLDPHGALFVRGADTLLPRLKQLTVCAQKNHIRIISSMDTHTKQDKEFRQFSPHCLGGTKGWRKMPQTLLKTKERETIRLGKKYSAEELSSIVSKARQIIVEKDALDIFSNQHLKSLFESLSPLQVIVYGVATDYCVKSAVEGLLALGIKVYLVKDAIKEIDRVTAKVLLRKYMENGVEFISAASVLKMMERRRP